MGQIIAAVRDGSIVEPSDDEVKQFDSREELSEIDQLTTPMIMNWSASDVVKLD